MNSQVEKSFRVFYAPLDWGLGHATRSYPIIQLLIHHGVEVHLGGNGLSLKFLQDSFPQLPVCELPGYDVRYGKGRRQAWTLIRQFNRVRKVISQEHRVTRDYIEANEIHATISDHRFGVWSSKLPSVVIAHQLSLRLPGGFAWARRMVDWLHARYLSPFDQLWVPDIVPPNGLAGELVSDFTYRKPDVYLGPLSRFDRKKVPENTPQRIPLALLSGPEPQRTILETTLIQQAVNHDIPLKIIQGLPDKPFEQFHEGPVQVLSFLGGERLAREIQQASVIISRAGYSSLMDFAALGTSGLLLVPTPGQTEQEYLANRLAALGAAHSRSQHRLDLVRDLPLARSSTGFIGGESQSVDLEAIIQRWIAQYKE